MTSKKSLDAIGNCDSRNPLSAHGCCDSESRLLLLASAKNLKRAPTDIEPDLKMGTEVIGILGFLNRWEEMPKLLVKMVPGEVK